MELNRRKFLLCFTAAVTAGPELVTPQGAHKMYGLIAKLTAVPGKRDELIAVLKDGTKSMPGCLSYILAKDSADENVLWVSEIGDSQASHDASLTLSAVKNAMAQGKPLIAVFERVAVTNPIEGVGLPEPR
jgi:quinol monooxygenase YgiN